MHPTSCHFRGTFRVARKLVVASIAALTIAASPAPPPASITGIWYDDTGKGAVEIRNCGKNLCGNIIWLKKPINQLGQPLTDKLNPSMKGRARPICGLQVIGKLKRQPDGSWDAGWIYDPKQGKAFDLELRLKSQNRLQVTGYLGLKFLSETFMWLRAPTNLKRCNT